MVSSTSIAGAVVSFLLSVIMLFNGLPIGDIANNAAHWDKDQIAEDRMQQTFDYIDAIMQRDFDGPIYVTGGGGTTETQPEDERYFEIDLSSMDNMLLWVSRVTSDENFYGGDFVNLDSSALDGKRYSDMKAIDLIYDVIQFLTDNAELISSVLTQGFDFGILGQVIPDVFGKNGLMGKLDINELLTALFAGGAGYDIELRQDAYGALILCHYHGEHKDGECDNPGENTFHEYYGWTNEEEVWNEETQAWEWVEVEYVECYTSLTDAEKASYSIENSLVKMFNRLLRSLAESLGADYDDAACFADSINTANMGLYAIVPYLVKELVTIGSDNLGDDIIHFLRQAFASFYGATSLYADYEEDDIRRTGIREDYVGYETAYETLLQYYSDNFEDGDYALFDYDLTIDGVAYKMFEASYKEDGTIVFYPYEDTVSGKDIAKVIEAVFDVRFAVPSDYTPASSVRNELVTDPETGTKYYIDENGAVYELYESVFPVAGEVDAETISTLTEDDLVAMGSTGLYTDGSFTQIDVDRTYRKDGYFYTHSNNGWNAWTIEENTTFYKNLNASLADLCALVDPYFVFNNNQYDFIDGAREVGGGFADQLNNIIATLLENSWTEEGLAELDWVAGGNENLNDNIMKFIRTVTARLFSEGTSTDVRNLAVLLREMGETESADMIEGLSKFFTAGYYTDATLESIVVDIALGVIDTTDILFSANFDMPSNIDSVEKLTAAIVIAALDEVFPELNMPAVYIKNGKLVDKTDAEWKQVIFDKGFELVMRLWAKESDTSAIIFTTEEIDNYILQGWNYMDFLDEIVDRLFVYIEGLVAVCDDLQCQLGVYDGNGPWYKVSKLVNALLPTTLFANCDKYYGDEYLPFDFGVFLEEGIAGNLLDFDVSGILGLITENASDFNPFYGNNALKGILICVQNLINAIFPGTIRDEDIVTTDHLFENETLAKIVAQLLNAINTRKKQLVPGIVSILELFGLFELVPFVDTQAGFAYFIREDEDGEYVEISEYLRRVEIGTVVEVPDEIAGLPVKGFATDYSMEGAVVHLPDTVEYFNREDWNQGYCTFTVNESNPYLTVVDDVLYNKDMTDILSYPNDKTDELFIVPATVKNIYASTFCNNYNLRVLKINEGTEAIYKSVNNNWYYFGNLDEIYIPNSVEYIDPDVFNTYQMEDAVIHGPLGSYAHQYYLEHASTLSSSWLRISFETYIPDELFVTFNTEKQAVKSNIYVYGYTMPGATIKVYDGDELIGKDNNIQISKNSKWEANVPLYKPVDSGSYHDITVVAEKDGKTVTSQTITVYYEKGAVVFKEFKMLHNNYYSVTVTDENINRPHSMTWIPGNNSDIRVRLLNSNKLVALYLVSNEGKTEYRVEMTRGDKDYWIAKDCFLGDPPGVIRLEGVIKNKDKLETVQIGGDIKINFLIDPSGNVYEFSTANPLEGVTTTVQYYDAANDEWITWDAEYYNQLNPTVTTADGGFKWIVPKGTWRVVCEKDGYETYVSDTYDIPPEVKNQQYFMTTTTAPTIDECTYADGIITITFDQYMNDSVENASAYSVEGADVTGVEWVNGAWSPMYYTQGYKTVRIYCNATEVPASVTLNDVYNYAGIAIAQDTTVVPADLTKYYDFTVFSDTTDIAVGDVVTLTLATEEEITDAVNVTVSNPAIFDSEYYIYDEFGDVAQTIDASVPETLTFDENGTASFTLAAGFAGTSTLTFKVGGSVVSYTVTVNAKAQNTEHVHAYGEAVVVKSTCQQAGYEYQECECGETIYIAYDLASHTPVEIVSENTLRSKATCRAKATYYYTCEVCDTVLKDGEVLEDGTTGNADYFADGEVLNHEFNENGACQTCAYIDLDYIPGCQHKTTVTNDIPATCTEDGLEGEVVCLACGDVVKNGTVIPANGHGSEVIPAVPATCTETGLTAGEKCPDCGEVIVAQTVVPKAGHAYDNGVVTTPATHTSTGVKTYTCNCGDAYTTVLPKTDKHTYTEEVLEEAQCKKDGKLLHICECGDSYTTTISALGHVDADDNSSCDRCGIKVCDHICHKDGFMGIIWKIIQIFWKLFGMNPVCECGKAHY